MLLQTLVRQPAAQSTVYDGQVLILHLPVAARMNPHSEATDTADDDDESNGFEAWTALQTATDYTRADLIADIVGHPQKAPSLKELD